MNKEELKNFYANAAFSWMEENLQFDTKQPGKPALKLKSDSDGIAHFLSNGGDMLRLQDVLGTVMADIADDDRRKTTELEAKLKAIVEWLEAYQSDVFRRGLWETIIAVERNGER
jgi:hypothetical protein